jgi:hypothetical protein
VTDPYKRLDNMRKAMSEQLKNTDFSNPESVAAFNVTREAYNVEFARLYTVTRLGIAGDGKA